MVHSVTLVENLPFVAENFGDKFVTKLLLEFEKPLKY